MVRGPQITKSAPRVAARRRQDCYSSVTRSVLLDAGDRRRARDLDVDRVAVEPDVRPGRDVERHRPLADDRAATGRRRRRRQVVRAAVELAARAVRDRARDPQAGPVLARWCRRRTAGCRWRRSRTAPRAACWCRASARTARPPPPGCGTSSPGTSEPSTNDVTGVQGVAPLPLNVRRIAVEVFFAAAGTEPRPVVVPSGSNQAVLRGHSPA